MSYHLTASLGAFPPVDPGDARVYQAYQVPQRYILQGPDRRALEYIRMAHPAVEAAQAIQTGATRSTTGGPGVQRPRAGDLLANLVGGQRGSGSSGGQAHTAPRKTFPGRPDRMETGGCDPKEGGCYTEVTSAGTRHIIDPSVPAEINPSVPAEKKVESKVVTAPTTPSPSPPPPPKDSYEDNVWMPRRLPGGAIPRYIPVKPVRGDGGSDIQVWGPRRIPGVRTGPRVSQGFKRPDVGPGISGCGCG